MSAEERNQIFRDRLIALMTDLNTTIGREKHLRRMIGLTADQLAHEAGARDWADLKQRADGPTYDSLLKLFQKQSDALQKAGDELGVRAFEVLAISLIARRQYQPDLYPGVNFLDRYIEECATNARRAGARFIPSARRRN